MAKLTTEEILALARKQDAGAATAPQPAAAESSAEEVPAAEPAPKSAAPAKPPTGGAPKSTADILAAARAEAAGGESPPPAKEPAPAKSAGGAPNSTADILAAARAEASSGAAKESPAAPAGTPSSTNDILAAARAQAGSGGVAKPAAAKPATPAEKQTAGGRPSVQDMLKAVKGETDEATSREKPTLPPMPQRPAPSKVRVDAEPRRNFLVSMFATPFALAWTTFTAASALATLGMARFMMPNAIVQPPTKFKIGFPDDYPFGVVNTKWKSQFAIWITHQVFNGQAQIYALSTVCTHLGCTPNWLEGEQKFKCPCHGSGFYGDGVNFEGPAPRPLERYGIKVASDGQLEVDKSVKFQEEMGQWTDAASFVPTSG